MKRLTAYCIAITTFAAGAVSVDAAPASADPNGLSAFAGMWQVQRMQRPPDRDRQRPMQQPRMDDRDGVSVLKIEGLDNGDRNVYRFMTPEGRAAFAAMDPKKLPSNNCLSPGVPTLAAIPNLQDWKLDGDVLAIHHESFDTRRTVYLDGRHAKGPLTQLGHAVGSYANGELTIVTTHMKASLGALSRNAPGSEQRTVTERYRLSPDAQHMTGTITIEDPLYLTRSLTRTVQLERAPAGTTIEAFPCDAAASQRYLN